MRERAHVGRRQAQLPWQLPLHGEVELVDVGPLHVGPDGFDAGRLQESRTLRVVNVREGVSGCLKSDGAPFTIVGALVATAIELMNVWRIAIRLCVAGLVPLVAAGVPIEDPGPGANGCLAISEGIPGKADARRNMVKLRGHNAACDPLSPGKSMPNGADGITVDCWPGTKAAVRFEDSTGECRYPNAAQISREPRCDAVVVLDEHRSSARRSSACDTACPAPCCSPGQ